MLIGFIGRLFALHSLGLAADFAGIVDLKQWYRTFKSIPASTNQVPSGVNTTFDGNAYTR